MPAFGQVVGVGGFAPSPPIPYKCVIIEGEKRIKRKENMEGVIRELARFLGISFEEAKQRVEQ